MSIFGSAWVSASMAISFESGSDARGRLDEARHAFERRLQRQARGRGMHRDGGDRLALDTHRHGDACDARHVFLVVGGVAARDDTVELLLEERAVGDGMRGE